MLRTILILFTFSLFTGLAAKPVNNTNNALNQVNAIRKAVQMEPFTYSTSLSRAAQNHASYLTNNIGKHFNGIDLHTESRARPGFSGADASSRSAKAAYPYRDVKENISVGSKNIADSISGLMSGIYHRFTFLDFLVDTIGFAVATDKEGFKSYVYNMGRKDMERTCSNRPQLAMPSKSVDCLGTTVNADYIEKACNNLPQEALYEAPFALACPNGRLLKSSYMDSICRTPPVEILLRGEGSYYKICQPEIRVNANWFNDLCNSNNSPALHSGENSYYNICENKIRVYASWFKNYCDSASPIDQSIESAYYSNLCHSDFKVSKKFSKELNARQYKKNPDYVVWPPLNANEVRPVFFDETPDPLPDLDVSGYPLSLQFNPGKVKSAKVSTFKLEKKSKNGKWTRIKAVREINHSNDPQKVFSKLQFAWFPLQRLDWNTTYRASVFAKIDESKNNIKWLFTTKSINTPLITVKSHQKKVLVPKDKWFTLYLVPSKDVSRPMQQINLAWRGFSKVKSNIIDLNTIKLIIENTHCQPVTLEMAQGRKLTLNTCKPS
jgi:hypothetical protein